MKNLIVMVAALLILPIIGLALYFTVQPHSKTLEDSSRGSGKTSTYTLSDVATHNTKVDCWTVIGGGVYDLTDYIPRHPGGEEMLRACGIDSTSYFEKRASRDGDTIGSGMPHSEAAMEQLEKLKIGSLN